MTCICIGDDRSQEVCVRNVAAVGFSSGDAFFSLFAIMEELGQEKLMDFIWNGILRSVSSHPLCLAYIAYHWVVCKIRRGFICRGCSRGTLPARDIDSIKVFCHLCKHCRLKTSIGEASIRVLDGLNIKSDLDLLTAIP